MFKRLLLLWIFSGSLDSFSQVADTTVPLREYNWSAEKPTGHLLDTKTGAILQLPDGSWYRPAPTPDTLRAICLVTMCRKCAAGPMAGYVVIAEGKEVEYLDCRKRALKLPQVGWGYRVVNPNERVR